MIGALVTALGFVPLEVGGMIHCSEPGAELKSKVGPPADVEMPEASR